MAAARRRQHFGIVFWDAKSAFRVAYNQGALFTRSVHRKSICAMFMRERASRSFPNAGLSASRFP